MAIFLCSSLSASCEFFAGSVWGKSQELVCESGNPDRVISQLDWPIEKLLVLGANLSLHYFSNRVHLTFEGWSQMAGKRVEMVDQDFFDSQLSQISIHPNTHQSGAHLVYVEGGYDFMAYRSWKLGAFLGYQHSQFKWKAYGGTFQYEQESGIFPNTLIIQYEQLFSVPYFGLNLKWEGERLRGVVFGKFSPFAYAQGTDHHVLREIVFVDRFRNKNYWIVGSQASWFFTARWALDLKYSYEAIGKALGDSWAFFPDATEVFNPASALIKHSHSNLELSLSTHW